MSRRWALAVCTFAALLVGAVFPSPAAAQGVPPLSGHVNDYADMLSPEEQQVIEDRLVKLEAETGAQVVILTEPSLDGGSLEDFTLRVVDTWELGREDVDDGLLIFVSRDDRKIRFEVGYGLEGPIPDITAKRIIDEQMVPRFRAGDYGGGIDAAAAAAEALIRGEELPAPFASSGGDSTAVGWIMIVAILALFAAALPKVLAWALYVAGIPMLGLTGWGLKGLAFGLFVTAMWVAGFPVVRFLARRIDWSTTAGPWSTGSHSGGGGGWSGGGFSGGGGGFGGGGASGGW